MKKNWKKLVGGLFVSSIVVGALAGCSSLTPESKQNKPKGDTETLLMYRIGDKPKNYDELMTVINKKMNDELSVNLDIQYITWGDYDKKMSVITSSNEDYDIAFVNNNYVSNAQKGAYADLTELLPEYGKETYEALPEVYIEGNKVDGKLYGVAVNSNVFADTVVTFDQALIEKYDLDISNIKGLEDLDEVLAVVKENEPTVVPFATGPTFRGAGRGSFDHIFDNSIPLGVDLAGDTTKIINPYEDSPSMIADLETMHTYYTKGYVPKDAATSDTNYRLIDSSWFARIETQGPMDYGDTLLTRAAKRPLVSKSIAIPRTNPGQAHMANFVVSSSSKNKEKAVEVINLINTDKEVLNTMVYGMEGENWERVGDDRMRFTDAYDPDQTIGGAWSVGNNHNLYIEESITDEQIAIRDKSIEEAMVSPIVGFNFNTDNVKTEISSVSNVTGQYLQGLHTGTLDPAVALPEFNKKLEEAGLSKIQAEIQKQYDEFLNQ